MRIFILLCSSLVFAQVELSSVIDRVHHNGAVVEFGNVTFALNSDAFSTASPEQPMFCRLALESGVTLADTRVEASLQGRLGSPIYLPIFLNQLDALGARVVAPRDSVAIVRWVAGEGEIWIRIQRSSSTWLQLEDGTPLAPSSTYQPAFLLGYRVPFYSSTIHNINNMTYPTRNPEISDYSTAVSTLICANLSGLGLRLDFYLYGSASAFHADAEISPGRFQAINPIPNFYDYPVASLAVTAQWALAGSLHGQTAAFQRADELMAGDAQAQLQLDIKEGPYSQDRTSEYWGRDSYLDLWLSSELEAGFMDSSPGFELFALAAGEIEMDPEQAFDYGGKRLYRHMRVKWTEDALDLNDWMDLTVKLRLGWNPAIQPEHIRISYAMVQANNPAFWFPVGDLPDHQVCAPITETLDQGIWRPFVQQNTLDFPHLTSATGGFSTQILLGNDGIEPLALQVQGFANTGEPLPLQSVTFHAGETRSLNPASFFEGPAGHLRILAGERTPIASLRYQARSEGAIPADVLASASAKEWRLYPAHQVGAWDGFALVNRGSTPSQVFLLSFDAEGNLLDERALGRLSPDEKLVMVLPDVPAASYHELRSEDSISLIALRGDSNNQYLWSNPVLRLAY